MTPDINLGPCPFPQAERTMSYAEADAYWNALPAQRQAAVMRWVNRWRSIEAGFRIVKGPSGQVYVEPCRASLPGHPRDRGRRRKALRLVEELHRNPTLADDVQINTIRVWHLAKATEDKRGATVQ